MGIRLTPYMRVYNKKYSSCYTVSKNILNLIITYLNKNKSLKGNLIDIGCGTGEILKEISKKFGERFSYYGMDYFFNPDNKNIKFFNKDLNKTFTNIPIKFDLIISTETIEHVINTDHFMRQIRKLLKPKGVLIITTPNLGFILNRVLLFFGYQPIFTEVSWEKSFIGSEIIPKIFNFFGFSKKLNYSIFGHLRLFTFRGLMQFLIYHSFEIRYKTGCVSSNIFNSLLNFFKVFPGLMPNIFIVARKK